MAVIFPKHAAVVAELKDALRYMSDEQLDVRLQVYEDGEWHLRFGDAQYDTDLRGYWSASTIEAGSDLGEVAEELLREIEEDYCLMVEMEKEMERGSYDYR